MDSVHAWNFIFFMPNDCLAHDYCVYKIFFLISISLLNYNSLYYVASENKGNPK